MEEYECKECGVKFMIVFSESNARVSYCPSCGSKVIEPTDVKVAILQTTRIK